MHTNEKLAILMARLDALSKAQTSNLQAEAVLLMILPK
jgi:hypothetical protein